MTQTITPNCDPRYSILLVEHDEHGQPIRLIEEPVTAWLHEMNEGGSAVTVRPLHPSNHLPGARHLKRPTGDLVNVKLGGVITPAQLVRLCRKVRIERKDIHLLNPAEWRSWLDELDV